MTDTANSTAPEAGPVQPQLAVLPLRWTHHRQLGQTYYRADITVDNTHYGFVIDKPYKSVWAARGWKNGNSFLYRDGERTLKGMKALVDQIFAAYIAESRGGAL